MINDWSSKNKTYKSKILLFSRYDQQSPHLNWVLRFDAKNYIFVKKSKKKEKLSILLIYIYKNSFSEKK